MRGGAAAAGLLALLCAPLMAQEALKAPDAFASITDDGARAAAIFEEMGRVLTHPRCMNCHPRDDTPRQGDDMAVHSPPVMRTEDGFGAPGMRCNTCHGEENVAFVNGPGSIPGNPAWHLAPISMGWIGLSVAEICAAIKDPERNGGMSLDELVTHNAEDELVGWGWEPGAGRTPVPGTQAQFGALTRAWVDAGAACPQ
ncbi:Isoquinoline 1-oxidoreductase subunit [Oceanicella sp. SM1341]|uniref:Isoquinoline 1-oxidoreductase subunit n=1 Tax=Oceanicella sp. SM1341 TaxID=1548889 RepID=UPI003512674C